MEKMRVGVVGCGSISGIYLENMIHKYENLEVVACCAAHFENAQKKAEEMGIEARTYEGILEDETIGMVVILTPASTHYGLIKQALEAGKHVYTEKVMTLELEKAKELMELAESKGLYLASAPDTFLGASLQSARKAIDEGLIGEVTGFIACGNRDTGFLASLLPFLRTPGGGICLDYGVYYVTALVSLLGPVKRVSAIVKNPSVKRLNDVPGTKDYGSYYEYPEESQLVSTMEFESGVMGTFAMNGETNEADMATFRIYGTKGTLVLSNPNYFGGQVKLIPNLKGGMVEAETETLPLGNAYDGNSRGIGPSELVEAIMQQRANRASSQQAYHVMDVLFSILRSSESQRFEAVESTCERPAPFYD